MLRAQIRALAMTTLACATFMACGDGKKSNSGINTQTLLTQLSEALQTCGVLGAGRLQNQVSALPETDAAQQQCLAGCVSAADCAALSDAFCNNGGSLLACVGACLQPKCGDGTVLSAGQLCDGTSDCADGSDEQGCAATLFECGEGDGTVSIQQRCDGSNDCEGGADEEGCPTFDCGDDSMVAEALRCDGLPDCQNGADEVGCPGFTCTSDSAVVIALDEVCDGVQDCPESEDEDGCAQFTCPARDR